MDAHDGVDPSDHAHRHVLPSLDVVAQARTYLDAPGDQLEEGPVSSQPHIVHKPTLEDQLGLGERMVNKDKLDYKLMELYDAVQDQQAAHTDQGQDITKYAERLDWAAALVDDAIHMRDPKHRMDRASLRIYRAYHSKTARALVLVTVFTIMLLAYFEFPTLYPLPISASACIEGLCLAILAFDGLIQLRVYGSSYIVHENAWVLGRFVIVAANLVDLIWACTHGGSTQRYTRMLRCYYLVDYNDSTHDLCKQVVATFSNMAKFILGLLCYMFIMAIIAIVLFSNTTDQADYMTNLFTTFLSLIELFTTDNFPDIMFPAYRQTRWSALFFIVYLGLGLYLGFNFLIALVYANFKKAAIKEATHNHILRRSALLASFHMIDSDHSGQIDFEEWSELYKKVCPTASDVESRACFESVDKDQSGYIDLEEFFQLCDSFILGVEKRKIYFKPLFKSKLLKRLLHHVVFEVMMNLIILANGILVVHTILSASPVYSYHDQLMYAIYDGLFLGLFILEVGLKNVVWGFASTWWLKYRSHGITAIY
eukprot:TRINITY_DN3770_c0_g1_i6.p1 TRINITY_DN3770_c0_g1~~TRINITY_DN3770_c0_g1_i6.p1  ORF type:complete len:539 (-),score=138.37 TRINITY_DN3770_c0_g1_i6:777-2393(-)